MKGQGRPLPTECKLGLPLRKGIEQYAPALRGSEERSFLHSTFVTFSELQQKVGKENSKVSSDADLIRPKNAQSATEVPFECVWEVISRAEVLHCVWTDHPTGWGRVVPCRLK